MNRKVVAVVIGCLLAGGTASAQLLAEVMTVAAVQAQFDSSVTLPRGTLRAVGDGVDALLARVEGSDAWQEWEAYTLGGVAAALGPAAVHQITTSYAVAGYFEETRDVRQVQGPSGTEEHTRIVFGGGDGPGTAGQRLLYVIRSGSEVVWLTARSR